MSARVESRRVEFERLWRWLIEKVIEMKEEGMDEDLAEGGSDPTEIREDVGTRIAPDIAVPDEVEESLRREREGEEVDGG